MEKLGVDCYDALEGETGWKSHKVPPLDKELYLIINILFNEEKENQSSPGNSSTRCSPVLGPTDYRQVFKMSLGNPRTQWLGSHWQDYHARLH